MKRILDSSILINYWHKRRTKRLADITPSDALQWGRDLIKLHDTDAIATPVLIEMLAGVTHAWELTLTKAFLEAFKCVDNQRVIRQDWADAIRLAQRVPRNSQPRQLGDCLIRAIANRLRYEVLSLDRGF